MKLSAYINKARVGDVIHLINARRNASRDLEVVAVYPVTLNDGQVMANIPDSYTVRVVRRANRVSIADALAYAEAMGAANL